MSATTTRAAEPDQACAGAIDVARAAAVEDAGQDQVGEHVGLEVPGDRIVTHLFACLNPGYVGWRWAVTVTRAARSKVVTVSESLLMPGPDSLLAPDWVPWTERIRPGDLKAGDLMPASADDERLVPAVALVGDLGFVDWEDGTAWNIGDVLAGSRPREAGGPEAGGRPEGGAEASGAAQATSGVAGRPVGEVVLRPRRVLSAIGRDETAARWYGSEHGPKSALASAAPANCLTCGFWIRLSGPLGRVFGVCANEFAPDDGGVVSADHGCGAHSDGDQVADEDDAAAPTVDEIGYDMLNAEAALPESVLETLDHELL